MSATASFSAGAMKQNVRSSGANGVYASALSIPGRLPLSARLCSGISIAGATMRPSVRPTRGFFERAVALDPKNLDALLGVGRVDYGEPLREARFPDFQAHLRSTRQHRRRPSPAPSAPHQQRDLFLRTCGHSPARMQLTTRNLARLRELYKNLAISQRELDQAASDQRTAKAICGRRCQLEARLPQPRGRGHSPTTRLRSRNVIRARSRLLLVGPGRCQESMLP